MKSAITQYMYTYLPSPCWMLNIYQHQLFIPIGFPWESQEISKIKVGGIKGGGEHLRECSQLGRTPRKADEARTCTCG